MADERYIQIPIETDDTALSHGAFDFLTDAIPEWTPREGQLDVWIIMAVARMVADLMDFASGVPDSIFRYFGQIIGVTPVSAAPATATTTWNLSDSLGHVIDIDTEVGIETPGGDVLRFSVATDVVIPPGPSVEAAVPITAIEGGEMYNDLGAVGSNVVLLDDYAWVDSIVLEGPTSGGANEEDNDVYMARLSGILQTMAPRPIIPPDFATLARETAGVWRALALDGYQPSDNTFGHEKMISLAVADQNGNALSAGVKTAVEDDLESRRELNFVVHVIDPTYTVVDVTYNVTAWDDYTLSTVESDVDAAIENFLDPSNWGVPPGGDNHFWFSRPAVKQLDIVAVIGSVVGVKDINAVTIRTGAGAFGTADVAVAGPAGLANSGVINGTVIY